jgi:hypothetical protein
MAVVPSHFQVLTSVVHYEALGKLASLATQISNSRRLNSTDTQKLIKQAKQITLWLQALDYSAYLTADQINQIKYALVHIAGVNNFGTAPVLGNVARPQILIGGGGTTIVNNTFTETTAFSNTDVDIGTETADTFAISEATGAVWYYTVTNGTAQRSGKVIASWLSDGSAIDCSEESTPDVGSSTSDVTLSVDINSGNVRLLATAASNNWTVLGRRLLIYV